MTKRIVRIAAAALALLASVPPAQGQAELVLSGDPQTLVVFSAVPGFGPDPAGDEGTTYSVSVADFSRVEAQLDAVLPAGVALWVRLEAPAGALGHGWVELTSTPQVLMSSIPPGSHPGLGIQYRLTATVEAGVVPLSSRQVTFTVRSAL